MNSHLSEVSFQRISTLVDVPLSIVSPPFCDGVPVSSLLRVRLESPIFTLLLLTVVVVPLTVKLLHVKSPTVAARALVLPAVNTSFNVGAVPVKSGATSHVAPLYFKIYPF